MKTKGNAFETTPERSAIMSKIRSKDTRPEMLLRRALHARGLRYRLHRRSLPGSPDLVFVSARVAVFVDGDFWHGRDLFEKGKAPRNNRTLWLAKLKGNRARDARDTARLLDAGWTVLRFWASSVEKSTAVCAGLVENIVRNPPSARPPREDREHAPPPPSSSSVARRCRSAAARTPSSRRT